MKLVIVSDLHLVAPGETLFCLDPLANLDACITSINEKFADADLVVFAGDLTNDAEPDAYAALAKRIPSLLPQHRMMMGNHDDRARFQAAFPDALVENGFVHSAVDCGSTRILMLDTLWPGHVEGQLCGRRLEWLDRQLAGAQDALIVMHHPPAPIGIASVDDSRLSNAGDLSAVLRRHGNVRHIFAGHVHRLCHGMWNGIPFTTMRSTCHQTALEFAGPHELSFEKPAYTVVMSQPAGLIVHTHEFGR